MENQLKKDYKAVNIAWNFLKKYSQEADKDDAYWADMLDEIARNGQHSYMCEKLCMAMADVMDHRRKSMERYGDISHDGELALAEVKEANRQREEERRKLREWRASK